jgi:hypothetical protein
MAIPEDAYGFQSGCVFGCTGQAGETLPFLRPDPVRPRTGACPGELVENGKEFIWIENGKNLREWKV